MTAASTEASPVVYERVAGVAYLVITFAGVLYSVGGTFELVFGLWLVFKGVDLEQWEKYA